MSEPLRPVLCKLIAPGDVARSGGLEAVLERLARAGRADRGVVPTGWAPVDAALPGGGLATDAVHEWLGGIDAWGGGAAGWLPPIGLLIGLARRAAGGGAVLWIGRRIWPHAHTLARAGLLGRSVLVDAQGPREAAWAADLALRGGGLAAVVADGRGLDMALTRRLQLAAEAGGGLALVARPACEARELSAAGTRWMVRPVPSPTAGPRWAVDLLRCKGLRPAAAGGLRWTVEWDHAQGAVAVPADVADRLGPQAVAG